MVSRHEMIDLYREWLAKISVAVKEKNGKELCESTRMALACAMILRTYFPEEIPIEAREELGKALSLASQTIDKLAAEGIGPDGANDLYQKNVHDRKEKFDNLASWWEVSP